MKNSAYTKEKFDANYPPGHEHSFWTIARNRIILRKLAPAILESDIILDVGCGRGHVVQFLRKYKINAYGCELGSAEPSFPEIRPFLYLNQNVLELPDSFLKQVSILLFLDVLEHIEKPEDFLLALVKKCPKARLAFITLPGRDELWTNYDVFYGHYRRYNFRTLRELTAPIANKQLRAGYFFHALYLPIVLAVLFRRDRDLTYTPPKSKLSFFFENTIASFFTLEECILPGVLPGSSIYSLVELRSQTI